MKDKIDSVREKKVRGPPSMTLRLSFLLVLMLALLHPGIQQCPQTSLTASGDYYDWGAETSVISWDNGGFTWTINICGTVTCNVANSAVCKSTQSWGTLPGAWAFAAAPKWSSGPGIGTCGGSVPFTSTLTLQCDLFASVPFVARAFFDGSCNLDFTLNTTAGCKWCKGAGGWPQQLNGDCSCNNRLPPSLFTQGLGLCDSNRWTYPKPSSSPVSSINLSSIIDTTTDQFFLRTSNLIIPAGEGLEFMVSIQPDGNGGNSISGGFMNVTGCITLGGSLTINFNNTSAFTTSGTPLVYSLIKYSCRNTNSIFGSIALLNLPNLGTAQARVVQGLTSVDLIIEEEIVVAPPPPPVTPPSTPILQAPISVSFNFTPSLQITAPSNNFTSFAFFRSLVECEVYSNQTGIIQDQATRIDFPTSRSNYSILQFEEVIDSVSVKHIVFSLILPNTAKVTLDFVTALSSDSFSVLSGNLTVPVDIYNIKYSISVTNWTFSSSSSPTTRLCLLTDFLDSTFQPFQSFRFIEGPIPQSSKLQFSIGLSTLELVLVNESISDGVSGVAVYYGMDAPQSQLWVALPRFLNTIEYDPNLGVVISPAATNDEGGEDSIAWIAAPIAGGVLAVVVVVVVVVVGVVLGMWLRSRRRKLLVSTLEANL